MAESLVSALYLLSPIVIGGVLHMVIVRMDLLQILARPINLTAFGRNKTWRGFLVMPLATVLGVQIVRFMDSFGFFGPMVQSPFPEGSTWYLGSLLGLGYVLSELPNSFVKRRLGITEGKLPEKNRFLFALVDQADCALGCGLVFLFVMNVSPGLLVLCVMLGPAVHLIFNVSLYATGLRREPF